MTGAIAGKTGLVKNVTDMGTVLQSFQKAGSAGVSQDWVALGGNFAVGAGKAAAARLNRIEQLKKFLQTDAAKKYLPTPTAIIDMTATAVTMVDLLNGIGPPNSGESFGAGSDRLETAVANLKRAVPDSRDWDGDAAQAYRKCTADLEGQLQKTRDLDKQMQALVAEQAGHVEGMHDFLTVIQGLLTLAQAAALALYTIPNVGPGVSYAWQLAFAATMTANVFGGQLNLLFHSRELREQAGGFATQYADVAYASSQIMHAVDTKIALPGAEKTQVGDFEAISASMSATPSRTTMPRLASLVARAGERYPVAAELARTNLGLDDAVPSAVGVASTPVGTPSAPLDPTVPGAISPTTARVAEPTQHASMRQQRGRGDAEQAVDANSTHLGPAERPASAAGGSDEPTPHDVVEPLAAAGGSGAERAPLDGQKIDPQRDAPIRGHQSPT